MIVRDRSRRRAKGRASAPALPHCDELFMRFFDRWYRDGDRARKLFKATRPDAEESAFRAGTPAAEASGFSRADQRRILAQVKKMADAAAGDWPGFLGAGGRLDLHWVDAFDRHWDRARISRMLETADPSDYSNSYLVTCCEFGAALGRVLLARCKGCEWLAGWPYWESAVYDPSTGSRINVFHWAVKKFSEYGVDDGFAAKVEACAALIESGWRTSSRRRR